MAESSQVGDGIRRCASPGGGLGQANFRLLLPLFRGGRAVRSCRRCPGNQSIRGLECDGHPVCPLHDWFGRSKRRRSVSRPDVQRLPTGVCDARCGWTRSCKGALGRVLHPGDSEPQRNRRSSSGDACPGQGLGTPLRYDERSRPTSGCCGTASQRVTRIRVSPGRDVRTATCKAGQLLIDLQYQELRRDLEDRRRAGLASQDYTKELDALCLGFGKAGRWAGSGRHVRRHDRHARCQRGEGHGPLRTGTCTE